MKAKIKFFVYRGRNRQFYWRATTGNNRKIAIGGEGYTRMQSVIRSWRRFMQLITATHSTTSSFVLLDGKKVVATWP